MSAGLASQQCLSWVGVHGDRRPVPALRELSIAVFFNPHGNLVWRFVWLYKMEPAGGGLCDALPTASFNEGPAAPAAGPLSADPLRLETDSTAERGLY